MDFVLPAASFMKTQRTSMFLIFSNATLTSHIPHIRSNLPGLIHDSWSPPNWLPRLDNLCTPSHRIFLGQNKVKMGAAANQALSGPAAHWPHISTATTLPDCTRVLSAPYSGAAAIDSRDDSGGWNIRKLW